MSALTWKNATMANGPRLVRWLDDQGFHIPGNLRHAWAAGTQASLDAIDRLLTRQGVHLSVVPDDIWEMPRKRAHRPVNQDTRVRVLAAYRELGTKKGAAAAARVPVSTARYIIDRERQAA